MKKQIRWRLVAGLAGVAALAMSGCGSKAPSAVQPMEIASDAGAQAIAQLDSNKDNYLDYNELSKAPGLRAGMAKIKKLPDGGGAAAESQLRGLKISAEEIDARIQQWKDLHTGRITVPCRVYRVAKKGGKRKLEPIDKAEVKFVPESFLGPGLTPGTGTTDKNGSAVISQPSRGGDDPAIGMCPGFYRVEITKGTEIPAKYNTATVLGQEVAGDALGLSTGGPVFELEY